MFLKDALCQASFYFLFMLFTFSPSCYSHSLLHILYFEIEMLVERVYVDLGAAGVNSNAHPFACENLRTICTLLLARQVKHKAPITATSKLNKVQFSLQLYHDW